RLHGRCHGQPAGTGLAEATRAADLHHPAAAARPQEGRGQQGQEGPQEAREAEEAREAGQERLGAPVPYLDYAASAPLRAEALAAMLPLLERPAATPSSQHAQGRAARAAVETAREQVAALVGVAPS